MFQHVRKSWLIKPTAINVLFNQVVELDICSTPPSTFSSRHWRMLINHLSSYVARAEFKCPECLGDPEPSA